MAGHFEALCKMPCAWCSRDIEPGDRVLWTREAKLIHATDQQPVKLVQPKCPVHFIELPVSGVCDDC